MTGDGSCQKRAHPGRQHARWCWAPRFCARRCWARSSRRRRPGVQSKPTESSSFRAGASTNLGSRQSMSHWTIKKIRTTAPRAIGTLSLVAASSVPPAQRSPAPTACWPLTLLSPKGTVVGEVCAGWEELADPDRVAKPGVRVAPGLSRSGAMGFESSGESPREPLPCSSFPPTRPAGRALRPAEVTDVVGWLLEAGRALGCPVLGGTGLVAPTA